VSESLDVGQHPLVRARLAAEQRWDAGLEQLLVFERQARWVAAQRYEAAPGWPSRSSGTRSGWTTGRRRSAPRSGWGRRPGGSACRPGGSSGPGS